jgi:hypothetical protein
MPAANSARDVALKSLHALRAPAQQQIAGQVGGRHRKEQHFFP